MHNSNVVEGTLMVGLLLTIRNLFPFYILTARKQTKAQSDNEPPKQELTRKTTVSAKKKGRASSIIICFELVSTGSSTRDGNVHTFGRLGVLLNLNIGFSSAYSLY